jgi:hypothetical protein
VSTFRLIEAEKANHPISLTARCSAPPGRAIACVCDQIATGVRARQAGRPWESRTCAFSNDSRSVGLMLCPGALAPHGQRCSLIFRRPRDVAIVVIPRARIAGDARDRRAESVYAPAAEGACSGEKVGARQVRRSRRPDERPVYRCSRLPVQKRASARVDTILTTQELAYLTGTLCRNELRPSSDERHVHQPQRVLAP